MRMPIVSALPTVSMVFEKPKQKQLKNYINNFVSLFLCGYINGYSIQFTLMALTINGKIALIRKDIQVQRWWYDTINHAQRISLVWGTSIRRLYEVCPSMYHIVRPLDVLFQSTAAVLIEDLSGRPKVA